MLTVRGEDLNSLFGCYYRRENLRQSLDKASEECQSEVQYLVSIFIVVVQRYATHTPDAWCNVAH